MAFMVGADVPTGGSENGPLRHVSYRNPTKMTPTILPEILSRFPQGSRHPPLYPARAHDTNYSVTGFSFPAGKSSSTALSCAGSRHQLQRHRLLVSRREVVIHRSILRGLTTPTTASQASPFIDHHLPHSTAVSSIVLRLLGSLSHLPSLPL